jgi:hypothetical protein
MKSNQSKSTGRSPGSVQPVAPAASVPISVYRELAAELQATRAMVDSLNGKSQQLDRENQQLRQEMQRVIYSVMSLQPWVNGMQAPIQAPLNVPEQPTWEETAAASAIAANLRMAQEPRSSNSPLNSSRAPVKAEDASALPTTDLADGLSKEWLSEAAALPQKVSQTQKVGRMGGIWLTLTILAIIVTAFGAGFLIMRPFLPTAPAAK